jgi:diaminopimelate decarboxylase
MDCRRDLLLREAADRIGTPCFAYFTDEVQTRIDLLGTQFANRFELSFAVKSNPNPEVLKWMRGRIGHLDISSIGEFRLACAAGWAPAQLSFTGPAKRETDLLEAIRNGIGLLVLESLREARLASGIASRLGRVQPVLLRIAPDKVPKGFGDQMAGRPTPFGIDIEDAGEALAQIAAMPGIHLAGLHIYAGTQCLKAEAIAENYRNYMAIFEQLCTRHAISPEILVLGSGLGVPYHDGDIPLDLPKLAKMVLPDIQSFCRKPLFRDTRLLLELGRYLVSEAGYFLTRVVSVKQSRGSRIAICDGGMNNHLPASGHFGMVVRRNYRMERLGTDEGAGTEKIDISGPLCTSIDRLAAGIELPRLEEGDLIAVHNSGAYGLTASPIHFISHEPPGEALIEGSSIRDISRDFGGGLPFRLGLDSTLAKPPDAPAPAEPRIRKSAA